MKNDSPITITFPGASIADANKYASDLAVSLRDVDPDIRAEQSKDRADTQDFGATVILILGTASATTVAKGIAGWLARSRVVIRMDATGFTLENVESKDAPKIVEALSKLKSKLK